MNVFHKVTLASLKKNRTRTAVTIIGIILSAAMICGVTTFVSSMQNYLVKSEIYRDGAWHALAKDRDYLEYQQICASDKVKAAVYAQQLGYAYADGCTNEWKPYLYVLGGSDGFVDMLSLHITAGKEPESSDEILLPEHLASNGNVRYKVGDTITLGLGNRVSDGYILTQDNPMTTSYAGEEKKDVADETLEIRESRTYTVVGFYKRPSWRIESYEAPGYTAITVADTVPSDSFLYDIFFMMNKPKEVFDFFQRNGYTGTLNSDVLLYQGASRYNGFYTMLYGLAAIIIALVMFGSVSLIYNAFAISVSERTKQFGLLSSVGATKKQLRKMVFFEAFIVAAVGVPVGIAAGVLGIAVTLYFIGNKFMSFGMPIKMGLYVSPVSVLIAAVVALVTVLISAWIPSKRATSVSAVEAIRQNMDIKIKRNSVKTSKLAYRVFGLPGMLAGKYFKRNRKKYRATVMSLFMSIVLFVSASAFSEYLMESYTGSFRTNKYDLSCGLSGEEFGGKTPEEVLELFQNDKDVNQVTYVLNRFVTVRISKEYLHESVVKAADDYLEVYGYIFFVRDSDFIALLKQYHLDEDTFMNPNQPLGIVIDGNVAFDRQEGKYKKTYIFNPDENLIECFDMMEENPVVEFTLKSGKTIYESPYYIGYSDGIQMIYPISQYTRVFPDEESDDGGYYQYCITSDNHSASYQNIKSVLTENGIEARTLYDYAEDVEDSRNQVLIMQVLSYGFIVLISLIAAANVFNTISTNISLRRREFAMLKSVGMTAGGLRRMMNYECLLYGSKSLLYGLPVACGVTYLIYRAIMAGYETTFRLPFAAIGIAILSVFLVVFSTMMYSMRKLRTDNLIDDLKNENI